MSQPEPKPIELPPPDAGRIAFSNSIQLSAWQWLGLAVFAVVFVAVAPWLWQRIEPLAVEPDFRMPHELSNDYWLFQRYATLAADKQDVAIFGDSVVWGEYVVPEGTLSHFLNQQPGQKRFANLGVGGAHQLALSGLIEHYAGAIRNMTVVLQCNPLWFSSKRVDLQDDSAEDFNHPRLIPQFRPRVPRYKVEISTRLGVLVEQRFPFNQWTNHLQQAYYEQKDIPSWTIVHPYEDPLQPLARGLPSLDHSPRYEQLPWYKTGKTKVDFDWIDLATSQQWQAFQRTVEILEGRGNQVLVVVGPFNEHMLTSASLLRYQKTKETISEWLKGRQVPHVIPAALASELYGDASHPLAAGYAHLARQLLDDPDFRSRTSTNTRR